MATATETLQMVLSAKDEASPIIAASAQKLAASMTLVSGTGQSLATKLAAAGSAAGTMGPKVAEAGTLLQQMGIHASSSHSQIRPFVSSIAMLTEQFGLLGPAGHIAGFGLLEFAGAGLTLGTIATGGVVLAITAIITLIEHFKEASKQAAEEIKKTGEAVKANDFSFIADGLEKAQAELDKVNQRYIQVTATGRADAIVVANVRDGFIKAAEAVARYSKAMDEINERGIRRVNEELEKQTKLLTQGPIEKPYIDALDKIARAQDALNDKKISPEIFTAITVAAVKLMAVEESLNKKKMFEIDTSPATAAIRQLFEAEMNLRRAEESGDAHAIELHRQEVEALKSKLAVLDQEIVKKRALELVTITQGLAEKGLLDSINTEMERQNALFKAGSISGRELNDNLKGLGELKTTFADIRAAADDFLKRGVKAGAADIGTMEKSITDLENRARETYGVAIPASVSAAIAKIHEFVKTLAEASGVDLKPLEENIKTALGALSGGAGISKGMGSLEGFGIIKNDFQGVIKLTDDWKNDLKGVSGTFSNLIGPIDNVRNATNGTAKDFDEAQQGADDMRVSLKSAPAILAAAAQNGAVLQRTIADSNDTAGSLAATLLSIQNTIAQINAQGGLQVVQ